MLSKKAFNDSASLIKQSKHEKQVTLGRGKYYKYYANVAFSQKTYVPNVCLYRSLNQTVPSNGSSALSDPLN